MGFFTQLITKTVTRSTTHVAHQTLAATQRAARRSASAEARAERRARMREEARSPFRGAGIKGYGGGAWTLVDSPIEWRSMTNQVCGLWPWSQSTGTPIVGTYLGDRMGTGDPVCFDPLSWFHRARLLSNPSVFVLGLPGLGKSTLIRKMLTGAIAQGVIPIVLGDLKGEYIAQIQLFGGQVVQLGRGRGHLNPLAVGSLGSILPILREAGQWEAYQRVREEVNGRRTQLTIALLTLIRYGRPLSETDEALIATAITLLDRDPRFAQQPPLLSDLVTCLEQGSDELRILTVAKDDDEYTATIRPLLQSLQALLSGPLGQIFSKQTTTPIDVTSTAVCIDVSTLDRSDKRLKAAIMLACWADGFGAIEAAHTLADLKLGPQRHFFAVMDELWQVLSSAPGMVERVDELTRNNRTIGTEVAMCTHTAKDMEVLPTEEDRKRAMGFIERCGAVIIGGVPRSELVKLESVMSFTGKEAAQITRWSAPGTLDIKTGEEKPPPGRGHFMLKVGNRPGVPFVTRLTTTEQQLDFHNTNQRFTTPHSTRVNSHNGAPVR